MAGTVLVEFKTKLVELIAQLPICADVEVRYADNLNSTANERVWLYRRSTGQQTPASLSPSRRRDETLTVTVWIEVIKPTPDKAEDRAILIGQAIEQAIADDPKVDNTNTLLWATVVGSETNTFETGEGSMTQHQLVVEARSRL